MHRSSSKSYAEKAETALTEDREDLARAVLERKVEHDRIADELEQSWTTAKQNARSSADAARDPNQAARSRQQKDTSHWLHVSAWHARVAVWLHRWRVPRGSRPPMKPLPAARARSMR